MRFSITPLGGAGRSVTRIVDAIARYLQPPHPRTLRRDIDAIGDWSWESHSAGDGFVLPRPGLAELAGAGATLAALTGLVRQARNDDNGGPSSG